LHFCIIDSTGEKHIAPLEVGPEGWCTVEAKGRVHTSEVPNLFLLKAKGLPDKAAANAPPKKKPKKRPHPEPKVPVAHPKEEALEVEAEAKEEFKEEGKEEAKGEPKEKFKEEAKDEGKGKYYQLLFYKREWLVGLRQKFGQKSQICSFGGAKFRHLSEACLRDVGNALIAQLDAGLEEAATKDWAMAQLASLP